MPIYAYKCSACGFAKDVLQKISDPVLSDCPHCGAATFAKQLTAAGFQLKGSGWYATDFKGGGSGATVPAAATATTSEPSPVSTVAKTEPAVSSTGGCATGCACHS